MRKLKRKKDTLLYFSYAQFWPSSSIPHANPTGLTHLFNKLYPWTRVCQGMWQPVMFIHHCYAFSKSLPNAQWLIICSLAAQDRANDLCSSAATCGWSGKQRLAPGIVLPGYKCLLHLWGTLQKSHSVFPEKNYLCLLSDMESVTQLSCWAFIVLQKKAYFIS